MNKINSFYPKDSQEGRTLHLDVIIVDILHYNKLK